MEIFIDGEDIIFVNTKRKRWSMERLTEFLNGEYIADCIYHNVTDDNGDFPYDGEGIDNVVSRLGEYEDAEEQGLMIRLPCKAGDTVYAIDGRNIQTLKANDDIALISGELCIFAENCHYADYISYDMIGKTVFFTLEEAEQKLNEMKDKFMKQHNEEIITDFLQFVVDNSDNEEFDNENGWSMSDLIELSIRFFNREQLK